MARRLLDNKARSDQWRYVSPRQQVVSGDIELEGMCAGAQIFFLRSSLLIEQAERLEQMTNSKKAMTAALTAAMIAGLMSVSTPASASGHHGYKVTLRHRANVVSPATHWVRYWGLENPESCGFWGWGDCRASGPAPIYATSAGYCGPAAPGVGSATGLGYYGTNYTADPYANYYSYSGGC